MSSGPCVSRRSQWGVRSAGRSRNEGRQRERLHSAPAIQEFPGKHSKQEGTGQPQPGKELHVSIGNVEEKKKQSTRLFPTLSVIHSILQRVSFAESRILK